MKCTYWSLAVFYITGGKHCVYLAILMNFASMIYEQLGELVEIATHSVLIWTHTIGKVKIRQPLVATTRTREATEPTSKGVLLNRSRLFTSAFSDKSHSVTLYDPSLAARCLKIRSHDHHACFAHASEPCSCKLLQASRSSLVNNS